MTTKDDYREAAREWMDAQAKVNAMIDERPFDAQAFAEALKHLDATGTKALTLARQRLAEASEGLRPK
jgi:hypothetical protein